MMKNASASGPAIVLIAVGVVIFFIAFFGCCGAWKENHCMVATFTVLLVLVILVEIAAVIAGYVFRNKLTDVVQDSLKNMISDYENGTAEFQHSLDKLQEDLKCCGFNGSSDWKDFSSDKKSVPDSCCVKVTPKCGVGAMTDAAKVHQE
ncbi:hypothetical protein FQN60_002281, partial [Etheostoma spectabile]